MLIVKTFWRKQPAFLMNSSSDADDLLRITTKIIEAIEVEIICHRPGVLYEIVGKLVDGGDQFSYYIANHDCQRPEGFAQEIEFAYEAYVENSSGATTASVRF